MNHKFKCNNKTYVFLQIVKTERSKHLYAFREEDGYMACFDLDFYRNDITFLTQITGSPLYKAMSENEET